jgi:glycosyltransferase involved in cell wall biosynthesis
MIVGDTNVSGSGSGDYSGPLISVITVTYNSSKYIGDTIESVLAQTYRNIEYIIGDDCSTDETWDIIQKYKDDRIVAYRNVQNLREYPNRNEAIRRAQGEYLIFIDGDDILYPHALELYVYYITLFPGCGLYVSRDWDPRVLAPCMLSPVDVYRFEYLDSGIIGGNFTNVLFNTSILKRNLIA